MRFIPCFCAVIALAATAACSVAPNGNNAMSSTQQGEWKPLFDGQTTNGWRGYKQSTVPAGWQVIDGTLTRNARTTDIITTEQYGSFELEFEWMVREGGNSGVFYRALETEGPIYHSAPEYQVLDDAAHGDGRNPLTSAGANYALHPAPRGVVKPAGEWNAGRIVVRGNHVEHWLNGTKIVEYELGSEDWKRRVAASKFNEWPPYGTAARGHIGLQGDHDWAAYRNIRIRVLADS